MKRQKSTRKVVVHEPANTALEIAGIEAWQRVLDTTLKSISAIDVSYERVNAMTRLREATMWLERDIERLKSTDVLLRKGIFGRG